MHRSLSLPHWIGYMLSLLGLYFQLCDFETTSPSLATLAQTHTQTDSTRLLTNLMKLPQFHTNYTKQHYAMLCYRIDFIRWNLIHTWRNGSRLFNRWAYPMQLTFCSWIQPSKARACMLAKSQPKICRQSDTKRKLESMVSRRFTKS